MARTLWRLAAALLLSSVVFNAAYAFLLLRVRVPMSGEAEILHEAARLKLHLALYTDPLRGTFDYGPYPTRAYVLYPPIWSWVLSWAPLGESALVGRALGLALWVGTLIALVRSASSEGRPVAIVVALYALGVHVLTAFAACARPDAAAVALSGMALASSMRRGRVGAPEGAAFALAALCKPNVVGLGAGALLATASLSPRRLLSAVAGGLAVLVPAIGWLHATSHGAFLQHLTMSVGQSLQFDVWWQQVSRRVLFVAPLAIVLVWGLERQKHDEKARLAFYALVASLAWTLFSLAKVGSASNYWLEPALGVVALAGRLSPPGPPREAAGQGMGFLPALAAAHALWLFVFTAGGVLEAWQKLPLRYDLAVRARQTCRPTPNDVVLSDSAGVEYLTDDRVLAPWFQTRSLIERGKMPLATYVGDALRPEAKCFISEGPLPFPEALASKFLLTEEAANFHLYRAAPAR